MYAQYELNIKLNDIISVWGAINKPKDFISQHSECPHIRKSSKSFKDLFPVINEWDKLENNKKSEEEETNGNKQEQGREESNNIEGHSVSVPNVGNDGSAMEKKV
jgi:hypothetical protein